MALTTAWLVAALTLKTVYGVTCLGLGVLLVVVQVVAFGVRALRSGTSAEQGKQALQEAVGALLAALEANKRATEATKRVASGARARGLNDTESRVLADELTQTALGAEHANDEAAEKIKDADAKAEEAATKWTVVAQLTRRVPFVVAGAAFVILGAVIMGYLKLSISS